MVDRLAAMPDVARHKWNIGAPVEDPVREQVVIEAAVREGEERGLAAETLRLAVAAQIEAAKTIQASLIGRWTEEQAGAFRDVPDLAAVLRPRIQEATQALVARFAAARMALRQCEAATALRALPPSLDDFPAAWNQAADGMIAAAGGPARRSCSP